MRRLLRTLVLLAAGAPLATATAAPPAAAAGVTVASPEATADLAADATYALPGAFTLDSTLPELRLRFGAANVRVAEIDGAEGERIKGVVLFEKDPSRRAELFLRDEDHETGIAEIRVTGRRSRWHFDNGVTLGMTLDALVAKNGAPVSYSGLGWDYGGAISDWNDGKLAPSPETFPLRALSLAPRDSASSDYPVGDGEFRSDDPKYPRAGTALVVGELRVLFEDRD